MARELQPQNRHAERLLKIGRLLAPKAHEVLLRESQFFAQRPQMLLDQIGVEAVVTRRHRRVRRKDHLARNLARRGIKVDAFFLHTAAHRLEDGEAAVTLIQMQDSGSDAHRLQSAESANAQQQLLPNARTRVAAIETRCRVQILRRIARNV